MHKATDQKCNWIETEETERNATNVHAVTLLVSYQLRCKGLDTVLRQIETSNYLAA